MSKARDLANLLGGGTSGAITFGGTAAIRVPNGTTAQRPTPAAGMIRYNTTTGFPEVYDGNVWAEFGAPPPSISTVSPSTYNGESGTTFTINGANFTADATVYFVTSGGTEVQAGSVSFVSGAQLTATTPQDFTVADEPLDVKVVQSSGQITKVDVIDCGGVPAWNTASGSLGTFDENDPETSVTVSATDPDSNATVAYSVASGALPTGLTIDNNTGVISGTTPVVDTLTTYNFGLRATDNAGNTSDRSFSIGVNLVDPNSNQTVLLLNGDGTNGAQNNTFLDSSTPPKTITRNGNTTQGTFSPFSVPEKYWSSHFSLSNSSGITVGTTLGNSTASASSTFTLEAWIFVDSYPDNSATYYYNSSIYSIGGTYFNFGIHSDGKLFLYHYDGGQRLITTSSLVSIGQWSHVAAVVTGNTLKIFLNGILVGSGTYYGHSGTNQTSCIGSTVDANASTSRHFRGNISNFRFSNNARYSSNFSVPTSPFVNDSNTVLLTLQSNRFVDNSTNPYTLTIESSTIRITPFSPFKVTAPYNPSVNGGSGYFDGSGDYLTTLNVTALNLYNTTNTVECWVYLNSLATTANIYGTDFDSNYYTSWTILSSSGYPYYLSRNGTGITGSVGVKINEWSHVAFGRSGNTVSIWLNGTRVANGTITVEDSWGTGLITIGWFNGDSRFNGYLSGLRVVKGTDVYGVSNTTITVPTAPLTAITNTSLLCNFTNAGLFDATGKNNLETVGNAQIDTTTKKYGTGSMEFDGTGDYLVAPNINNFTLSGPFTIEAWVYRNTASSRVILIEGRTGGGYYNYLVGVLPNGTIEFVTANSDNLYVISETVASGQWVHVALVRNASNVCKFYIDGVGASTTKTISGTLTPAASSVWIGAQRDPQYTDGYIDDLRITKGVARYTTNFTPPTKALRIK